MPGAVRTVRLRQSCSLTRLPRVVEFNKGTELPRDEMLTPRAFRSGSRSGLTSRSRGATSKVAPASMQLLVSEPAPKRGTLSVCIGYHDIHVAGRVRRDGCAHPRAARDDD